MGIPILADEQRLQGRKVKDSESLPRFEIVSRDGHNMRFRHIDTAQPKPGRTRGRDIHFDYLRHEGEVFSIGSMSRLENDGFKYYSAHQVEQAVLRNAFGELEGKLQVLQKPLPKAFALTTFKDIKCEKCKRHVESKSLQAIFEKSDDGTGKPIREGCNIVYFFNRWREHPFDNPFNKRPAE